MYTVLISAVGGDIGQGILKSITSTRPRFRIIGCDMNPNSSGLFLCDKGYIVASAKNNKKKHFTGRQKSVKLVSFNTLSLAVSFPE